MQACGSDAGNTFFCQEKTSRKIWQISAEDERQCVPEAAGAVLAKQSYLFDAWSAPRPITRKT